MPYESDEDCIVVCPQLGSAAPSDPDSQHDRDGGQGGTSAYSGHDGRPSRFITMRQLKLDLGGGEWVAIGCRHVEWRVATSPIWAVVNVD